MPGAAEGGDFRMAELDPGELLKKLDVLGLEPGQPASM
jgi:hypothetical protein